MPRRSDGLNSDPSKYATVSDPESARVNTSSQTSIAAVAFSTSTPLSKPPTPITSSTPIAKSATMPPTVTPASRTSPPTPAPTNSTSKLPTPIISATTPNPIAANDDVRTSSALASSSTLKQVQDVEEVPFQPTASKASLPDDPPFTILDYEFVNGFANLEQVIIPDFTSREIDVDHVANLKNLFETKSFNPVIGAFVVSQRNKGARTQLDKNKMLVGQCLLVDGRHRFNAVQNLYEAKPDKWSHLWKRAPIACVERKDGQEITILETLALSAYFNDLSAAVLKVTFLDHVHAAIQTVRIITLHYETFPSNLTLTEITNALQDRRTLGDIDHRQLRRYAAVAQKLAMYTDFYYSVKSFCGSCPGIGLVHLNSTILLSVKDLDLWQLALASLRALVINGVQGSFELMHEKFYGCVKKMFDVIRKTASHKVMPLSSLMESKLYITAHNPKTVFEYIADTMSRYVMVENQDAADKTRVRNLKKKLIQLLGEDIEPDEPEGIAAQTSTPTQANSSANEWKRAVENGAASRKTGVRRSTRKRKNVILESDDDSDDRVGTRRPAKKPRAKVGKHSKQQSVTLSESTVSTFLKALAPEQLNRLIDNLGVQVSLKERSLPEKSPRVSANAALEAASPLEVLPGFYDSFDDNLPATLPEAWADPAPYTGTAQPSWLRFLTKIPSKWPKESPIAHVTPWLEAMHVPHEHRAHSVITNLELLRRNHHAVYYRAAHSYLKHRPVSELPDLTQRFGKNLITAHEKLWCSAMVEDDAAMEFFAAKKERLSTEGFCILESFFNDEQMPKQIGLFHFPHFLCPKPFFKSLEDEARESFPGEESLTSPEARTTWNIMQNVSGSVDSTAVIQGQGRFRMTNYGILERLEKDSDKVWTISGRALVDIRVGQCMAALKLTRQLGSKLLFMPRTGGRWTITSEQCQRQALHTDFKSLTRHETLLDKKSPGYFTIATGQQEVPIWICSHSHLLAATSSKTKMRAASSASAVHVIRIPPFSLFVGRGDLYYAGLATTDAIGKHRSLYYHSFFVPEESDIPRALSGHPDFNPRFTANIDDESDSANEVPTAAPTEPIGSVKKPRVRPPDFDGYHSDDFAENDDDDEDNNGDNGDDDGDVDYSQYL